MKFSHVCNLYNHFTIVKVKLITLLKHTKFVLRLYMEIPSVMKIE